MFESEEVFRHSLAKYKILDEEPSVFAIDEDDTIRSVARVKNIIQNDIPDYEYINFLINGDKQTTKTKFRMVGEHMIRMVGVRIRF